MNLHFTKEVKDILFPKICPICLKESPDQTIQICNPCNKSLSYIGSLTCTGCGGNLDTALDICSDCLSTTRSWRKAFTVYEFSGRAREIIHRLKYKGETALVRFLGFALFESLTNRCNMRDYTYICPVPLHPFKVMRRGFNQSSLIAIELSKFSDTPVANLLKRVRWTSPQTHLTRKDRLKNLRKSFKIKKKVDLKNMNIIVVDDVLTTGATLEACVRVLIDAGAQAVDIVTLARG